MYSVSEEYSKAIAQPVRNFKITVRFRYQNAPQAVFEDDKVIGEVKIESQAVSGSSTCGIIDIGAVPSATAQLTIIDDDTDLHRYAGASFTIKVSLQLENGEYEDVPMGSFFCDTSKMSRVGNQISVFGYDAMTSLDYVIPDSHKRQIQGKSACDSVWVLVAYGHCGFNQDLSEFPNSNIPLDFSSPQVETARDAIMWIAQLMGCFAHINRRNYLEFVPIKSTWEWLNDDHTLGTIIAVRNIDETARYKTKFSDDRIHIVGVSMPDQNNDLITRGGGGLADDSNVTITLEKNPLIANSEKPLTSILDDILTQLRTAYFYAFSAEITSDPALDVGDTIRLRGGMINGTNKNNDLIGFITHNVWRYCGKHEVINTGQTPIACGSGAETAAISLFSDDDTDIHAVASGNDEAFHVAPRPQSEKQILGNGGGGKDKLVASDGSQFIISDYNMLKLVNSNNEQLYYFQSFVKGDGYKFNVYVGRSPTYNGFEVTCNDSGYLHVGARGTAPTVARIDVDINRDIDKTVSLKFTIGDEKRMVILGHDSIIYRVWDSYSRKQYKVPLTEVEWG